MKINAIICINSINNAIGYNNNLLFRLKKDMAMFKQITTNVDNNKNKNAVLMGYNTFSSIPTLYLPLKNRINIIISKHNYINVKAQIHKHKYIDTYVFSNIHNALAFCMSSKYIETLYVIGGASIYNYFVNNNLIHEFYITELNNPELVIGDTYLECKDIIDKNYIKHHLQSFIELNALNLIDNKKYKVSYSLFKYINTHISKPMNIITDEHNYLSKLKYILEHGELRKTRNSETLSAFGVKMEFNLQRGFPLLTTKKMFWKGIKEELVWFLNADTNSKYLSDKGIRIWDGNSNREFLDSIGLTSYKEFDCGPIYGFQWRHFNATYKGCDADYTNKGTDQLLNVINLLKTNPTSRRIFMSAWNPEQMDEMALPPCHISYQFYVSEGNKLQCQMYQRSGDMFLGIPFNIASTSLLTHIIAKMTNLIPDKVILIVGDAHIYTSHIEQVKLQLERQPYSFPSLVISDKKNTIEEYKSSDFKLVNYINYPSIRAKMIA